MIITKYNRKIINSLIRIISPTKARHSELSLLMSSDDSPPAPSSRLMELMSKVLINIKDTSLNDIELRTAASKQYVNVWPGEHYKFLATIIKVLKPKVVIEIGTATGLSALAMKKYLSDNAKITTFDIIKWQNYPDKCLREEDFLDNKLEQCVDDLSKEETITKYKELLQEADLIFIDAEKDGTLEKKILENLRLVTFKNAPIIIFDDIHLWNMLKIWRNISMPKLDVTSFGHWSGTGIVDWKNKSL